ncbi:MAG: ERAP1-like C-terminal domain-containing protein, partial [Actinobacteria bacterium]|nr:ERAP1-like C-terminal domain-containing protein [Actinomycetota bacterium]
MLEQFIGDEQFLNGVSHYLRLHTLGNTETSDLWDAIEKANPATPVRRLMDSWIWQPGYPLLTAKLDGGDLVIGQQRFAYGDSDDATLWVVPVHVRIDGSESKVLLDGNETRLALPSPDSVVVVNAGGHGFVRVAYDDALRSRLVGDALTQLTIIDRYNLVDDAWNAVVAGRLGALELVDFVEGFVDERDLAVWQAIATALRGVGRLVEGDAYESFRARVRALATPALEALGWDPAPDEDDLTGKLRGLLVGLVAVLGNDAAVQQRC